jgi:mitochondrial splicing suppressor protein 51
VPKPNDARSVQIQAGNEAAYRQLLVQGVLALLLPADDLENECLTSLVGQIFSELIIGNLIANKLSEPWMLLEIFIILTRLAKRDPQSPGTPAAKSDKPDIHHDQESLKESPRRSPGRSITRLFWAVVQWGFLLVSAIRLIAGTIVMSRSLPPRGTPLQGQELKLSKSTGHYDGEKPSKTTARVQTLTRVPIVDFKLWPCVANLLEVDARMPWLGSALSMMQWGAMTGPGNIAGYDGAFDR